MMPSVPRRVPPPSVLLTWGAPAVAGAVTWAGLLWFGAWLGFGWAWPLASAEAAFLAGAGTWASASAAVDIARWARRKGRHRGGRTRR